MLFSTLHPIVEEVVASLNVQPTTNFTQFVQDELAEVPVTEQEGTLTNKNLAELYELRARHLDWELGTGYLGIFSEKAGTRYAFTRIIETVYQMVVSHIRTLREEMSRKPPFRILEIGCGAGLLGIQLAQAGHLVAGLDIAFAALKFANTVKDRLHEQQVSFQRGDAETLMFQDQVFDVVICSEVLEHLIHPEHALAEMRRVVKKDGIVILSTPCAVSLSDLAMRLVRTVSPQIEAAKDRHFDKKTYLAVQRTTPHAAIKRTTFLRVHERFQYAALLAMFHQAEFEVDQARGAVFAFPPHYQVFYRYCPAFALPGIRLLEQVLNTLNLFQRFGSVTTCFRLKPS